MKETDLLSISKFSKIVGVPMSTLRYYDEIGLFSPAISSADSENNYRYYAPLQITTIKRIRVLTKLGVPLKIIIKMENNRTPSEMLAFLNEYTSQIYDRICHLQDSYSILRTFTEFLRHGLTANEKELSVEYMDEMPIILSAPNKFKSPHFYEAFADFCSRQHGTPLNLCYPIGAMFENMNAFIERPSQPARFFSAAPNGNDKKREGLYLVGYTRGYYGQANDLPQQMNEYAQKNNLVFEGAVYNLYLFDEISVACPENYLLQVCAPIAAA
ncbi:MAG: MerR family transcriptional regulator [Tannerellaceae bacterium]|nr:MerR family transcriptional regulator [Tannerellaceae bacterium]